ncbi:MAG: AbrB/MazE/SpoVT family DNA-binding domain-containing protein [Candidatus Thermoplasmatota archaeon]
MANIATVTSKGQVTIPASVRRRLGIREGTRIVFLESGDDVRVVTEDSLEEQFAVFDRMRKRAKLTRAQLQDYVKEAKDRLWKERYARGR